MKKVIFLFIVNFVFLTILCFSSEDTVDLSSILPGGGQFTNGALGWSIQSSAGQSEVVSYTAPGEGWVGLRCYAGLTTRRAFISIANVSTSATIDIATTSFDQLVLQMKVRGNPTLGDSTIMGIFQPEVYSVYFPFSVTVIQPGSSPAYQNAISFNTFHPFTPSNAPMVYGRLSTWVWLNWRFSMIPQNHYRIGAVILKYNADPIGDPPGPTITTELQIDEVKLLGIRLH